MRNIGTINTASGNSWVKQNDHQERLASPKTCRREKLYEENTANDQRQHRRGKAGHQDAVERIPEKGRIERLLAKLSRVGAFGQERGRENGMSPPAASAPPTASTGWDIRRRAMVIKHQHIDHECGAVVLRVAVPELPLDYAVISPTPSAY
jgi:hypothetical protein